MKKRLLSVMAILLLLIGLIPVGTAAEGLTPITEITVSGVRRPVVTAGKPVEFSPGSMTVLGGVPAYVTGAVIVVSSDDGDEDPYEAAGDTTAEAGYYYGAEVTLGAGEGYYFDSNTSLALFEDADDEDSGVSYSNLSVSEQTLSFLLKFGQAGDPEDPEEPEEPEEPVVHDVGRIDISIPEAEYGQPAVKPEDYTIYGNDGQPVYMVVFSSNWEGNLDGEGRFKAGETYNIPFSVAALAGYILGPETEIYVNGKCLFAKSGDHYFSSVPLSYQSTTEGLPNSYPITLLPPENASLASLNANYQVITESVAGAMILIKAVPQEKHQIASAYAYLTNDNQQTVPVEEANREEDGTTYFKFTMPEGGVTVGVTVTGLPKAETPEAVLVITGPASAALTNVDTSMKWSQDGVNYTMVTQSPQEIPNVQPGVIYVIRCGDYVNTSDSDRQVLEVRKAAAPMGLTAVNCTTEENNDGKITGVDPALEWRVSGEGEFSPAGAEELTDLVPGDYEFRYPFDGERLASDSVTVRVGAYEPEEPEDPEDPEEPSFSITISGGAAYIDNVKVNTAKEGETITIRAEAEEGKVFVSWNTNQESVVLEDPESETTTFIMPAEEVIIMAEFEDAPDPGYEYIVNFESNGGEGLMNYQTFHEKIVQKLNANQFTREGYLFLGWSTTADGEVEYEDGAEITKPLVKENQVCTLYAVWESIEPVQEYSVLVSGGTAYADGAVITSAEEGTEITIIAEEKEGKIFVKWIYNENFEMADPESPETTFVMPAENVVIMAQFEDEVDLGFEYTVEFNGNGADAGEMEDQIFHEKEEQKLNLNQYTREGYTFMGWSKGETGEAEYEDGELITEPLVSKEGQIRTLYAVWEEEEPEESESDEPEESESDEPETSPSETEPSSETPAPTDPTYETHPTMPPSSSNPPANTEQWQTPAPSVPSSSEQEIVPVVVNTTDEETEVETPEAESTEEITNREPSAETLPTVPPSTENTEKEEQAVKRIRLVLGIAIGVVAAAIVVAVVFYQKEKRRHGSLL